MLKKYLLSLVLLFGGAMLSLNAQSDSFFKSNDSDAYNDRDGITNSMTLGGIQNTETPVPVGSGLLIMMAAGAGYAVLRRNNFARKGMTMILALGLILGMTQCKKNVVTPVTPTGNGIQITLNANAGGQKTVFPSDHSGFYWSNATEYINVSGKVSGYLGQLTGVGDGESSSISFSGTINEPAAGETMLYFFYLGNGDHAGATTLDFSSQTGSQSEVTNWHIAIGQAEYTGGGSYSTTLNMAMAIAWVDLRDDFRDADGNMETVYMHGNGIYTTAVIDYNNGTITGNTKGYINLGTAAVKCVALIPSGNTSTVVYFDSNSKTGSMGLPNGITAGTFFSSNGGYAMYIPGHTPGNGTTPGLFSVAADKMVRFSKGNLQYQASTSTWRFAGNQYDAIGNNAGNNNFTETRSTQSDWIDLFGWGTSGWNNGNANYMPYDNWYTSSSYAYGYGPMVKEGYTYNYQLDLAGDYANADWGVYNTISNGGTGWRTLTGGSEGELGYMLNNRTASKINNVNNARYAKATVNNVNGLILFPDNYTHPDNVSLPSNINVTGSGGWTSNVYTDSQWEQMEVAGAVFFPVTGIADNKEIKETNCGYYWASTHYTSSGKYYAHRLKMANMELSNTYQYRYYGSAVRLVKDID